MKKTMSVAFIGMVMMVALVMLESAAVAQQSPYTINVPFSFNMGMQTLPAGEYRVGTIRPGVIYLRGIDNTNYGTANTAFISSERGQAPVAKMVFHQYGNRYFLSQVWFPDMKTGSQLTKSRVEVEVAQNMGRKADTELVGK